MSGTHGAGGRPPEEFRGRRNRVSNDDAAAQKAQNAEAPRIPNLLGRIRSLFAPHGKKLTVTVILVLLAAALSVLPPLLIQRAFD